METNDIEIKNEVKQEVHFKENSLINIESLLIKYEENQQSI